MKDFKIFLIYAAFLISILAVLFALKYIFNMHAWRAVEHLCVLFSVYFISDNLIKWIVKNEENET